MAIAIEKNDCARLRAGSAGVFKMAAGLNYSAFEKILNFSVEDGAPGKFAGPADRFDAIRIHADGKAHLPETETQLPQYVNQFGRIAERDIRGIRMRHRFRRTNRARDVI